MARRFQPPVLDTTAATAAEADDTRALDLVVADLDRRMTVLVRARREHDPEGAMHILAHVIAVATDLTRDVCHAAWEQDTVAVARILLAIRDDAARALRDREADLRAIALADDD